ncbi:MAG: hypothetical protein Q8L09_01265 [Candidatus Moranbacteria bacterium]|nr:hypothetical protein [Candidatus Moranbacteria bacterium]
MKYKVILAFVFSPFLVFSARAQDISGAEKIVSFDGEIKINQNSTVDVEEIIAYDFGDAQKHGIYVYKTQR